MQQENTGAQRPQEEEYLFQLAKLEVRIRAMSAQEKEKYADKIAEVQKHLARLTPAQRQAVAGHMARMQGAQAQPPVQGPAQAPAQGETPAQSQAPAQSEAAATPSEGPMEKQAAAPAAPRPGGGEEEEEEEDVPVKTKKAKKKKRKGPGCLVAVIAVFLVLVAAASFGISWYFNEINGNRGQNSYTATVTIEQGSGPLTIGRALQQQGIIRSAQIFRLYVRQQGVADTLQYGTFELSSAMSYDEIITALQQTQDDRETVRVTFPEGITATQFAARMEEAGLCTADEFLDVANNADFSQFEFWAHRDEDPAQFMKSEGYLFPDTYDFFVGDDVYNMVARIYQEFNTKYLENDLQGKAEAMGFTLTQYVTLASLVQEEAGGAEHQADVAAIFMNRMAEGSPVPRLESNTSSYIQNDNDNNYLNNTVAKVLGGWENIPQEVIDGYDTYSREGLPVGPISNPGLDALLNTTRYAESQYYGNGYYFFVTDINGNYYFNQTAEAHEAQVDELKAQKPLVQAYVMDEIFDKMIGSEAAVGVYYSGDAITMIDDNPDLAWVFPEEGTVLSVDSMAIPATSEHEEAAEMFINFMCEPDVGKANIEYIGYTTPMHCVWEILDEDLKYSEIAYPSEDIAAKEEVFTALSDEVNSELDVKWSEMKSYDEGGSGYLFLMLLAAMLALACFNIWRKVRRKTRNMY